MRALDPAGQVSSVDLDVQAAGIAADGESEDEVVGPGSLDVDCVGEPFAAGEPADERSPVVGELDVGAIVAAMHVSDVVAIGIVDRDPFAAVVEVDGPNRRGAGDLRDSIVECHDRFRQVRRIWIGHHEERRIAVDQRAVPTRGDPTFRGAGLEHAEQMSVRVPGPQRDVASRELEPFELFGLADPASGGDDRLPLRLNAQVASGTGSNRDQAVVERLDGEELTLVALDLLEVDVGDQFLVRDSEIPALVAIEEAEFNVGARDVRGAEGRPDRFR